MALGHGHCRAEKKNTSYIASSYDVYPRETMEHTQLMMDYLRQYCVSLLTLLGELQNFPLMVAWNGLDITALIGCRITVEVSL